MGEAPKQQAPSPPPEQQRRPGLEEVLFLFARELHEATQQRKIEFEWAKEHRDLATKKDLEQMEQRLSALIKAGSGPQKRVRFDWAVGPVTNKNQ